ncbi:unnamed protein product [Acidithrix sp. C25]|nr:unnamed protein product [Acidithrix sp. C25]
MDFDLAHSPFFDWATTFGPMTLAGYGFRYLLELLGGHWSNS